MDKKLRKAIRQNYKDLMDDIVASYPKTDIYFIDWINIFSKAERLAWDDIRLVGAPLYPQFPVGPYFLDFGDPVKKIGIEIDSKEYHKNLEKDKVRQTKIEKLGWKIYRFNWEDLIDQKIQPKDKDDYPASEPYFESNFLKVLKEIYPITLPE